jgi:hypothetical protein
VSGLLFLDASAIVKLVVDEAESEALRGRPARMSSTLAIVEVRLAAARRTPTPPPGRVDTILAGLALIPIDQATLEDAARLGRRASLRRLVL